MYRVYRVYRVHRFIGFRVNKGLGFSEYPISKWTPIHAGFSLSFEQFRISLKASAKVATVLTWTLRHFKQ